MGKLLIWWLLTLDALRLLFRVLSNCLCVSVVQCSNFFGIALQASPVFDPLGQLVYTNSRQVRPFCCPRPVHLEETQFKEATEELCHAKYTIGTFDCHADVWQGGDVLAKPHQEPNGVSILNTSTDQYRCSNTCNVNLFAKDCWVMLIMPSIINCNLYFPLC